MDAPKSYMQTFGRRRRVESLETRKEKFVLDIEVHNKKSETDNKHWKPWTLDGGFVVYAYNKKNAYKMLEALMKKHELTFNTDKNDKMDL